MERDVWVHRVRSGGIFDGRSGRGLAGAHGSDDDDADEDERGSQDGAEAEGFAGEEVSDENGDERVDVGVGSDAGGRVVVEQPEVGGESDD